MRSVIALIISVIVAVSPCIGITIVVGQPAAITSPTPDLLWWKLNDASGTAIAGSASGAGDAGTTDADWITGASGSGTSLDFNGTSDDAGTTASITYASSVITVTFWHYSDDNTTTQVIAESSANWVGTSQSWSISVAAGSLSCGMRGTSGFRAETITLPATGAWHHYTVILDNSTVTGDVIIYLDGAAQSTTIATNSKTGSGTFSANTVFAGARNRASLWLNGRLDDVRIYDRQITGVEITSVYGNPQ